MAINPNQQLSSPESNPNKTEWAKRDKIVSNLIKNNIRPFLPFEQPFADAETMSHAPIDYPNKKQDTVTIGSVVYLRFPDGEEEVYLASEYPNDSLSIPTINLSRSPLGNVILGAKASETKPITLKIGNMGQEVYVLAIEQISSDADIAVYIK